MKPANRFFTPLLIVLAVVVLTCLAYWHFTNPFRGYVRFKVGWNDLYLDPLIVAGMDRPQKAMPEIFHNILVFINPLWAARPPESLDFPLGNATCKVGFDNGPSDDPSFWVKQVSGSDSIRSRAAFLPGEKMYVSAKGEFHVENRNGQCFLHKRKYEFRDGEFCELAQPFYLINRNTRTSSDLLMYEHKGNQGRVMAKVPKGSSVRVLLKENSLGEDNYLVANGHGLVGWVVSTCGSNPHNSGPLDLGSLFPTPGDPLSILVFEGD
jgi:hypothetical protein